MESTDAEAMTQLAGHSSPPGADPEERELDVPPALTQEELSALWENEPLTSILCEANGVSANNFQNKPASYQRIDMFLSNFPRMTPLAAFSGLTSLYLIHQEITEISCISRCRHLVECVIMECQIEEITGLENCTAMETLDLSGNRIRKISGLCNLTKLRKLWIAECDLKSITGLTTLTQLTDLNLAGNRIEQIGTGLSHNHALKVLNLADNRIGGFKDLLNLTHLPELTKLILQDAQYGSNFVCALCNYQTYVLCHVQHITSLDNSVVTPAAHQTAEATFIKKKMYYNMRIKTLKRSSSAVIKQAMEMRTSTLARVGLNVNVLVRHCKDIERELEEQEQGVANLVPGCTPIAESAAALGVDSGGYCMVLKKKLSKLRDALKAKEGEIEAVEARFEHARQAITEVTHQQISRLVLELETGGNIRLEDGKPSDAWYSSCVDLMRSRFFANDFVDSNVGGIWIQRVTRVHNRCLRNHFEEKVDQYCAETGTDLEGGKRALEYLFAAEHPQLPGELHRMTEFGFRDVEELEELGLGDSVQLSNSLTFVEPITKAKVIAARDNTPLVLPPGVQSQDASAPGSSRRTVLVTKVLLGNSTAEVIKKPPRDYKALLGSSRGSPTPGSPKSSAPEPLPDEKHIQANHSEEFDSVYRCNPEDPKQKQWFVFDSGMILPEYLVEYENASVEGWEKYGLDGPDHTAILEAAGIKPEIVAGMGPLALPFENFVQECTVIVPCENTVDPVMSVVNAAPMTAVRPKLQVIVPDALARYYNGLLANLMYLNLHSNNIRQLEHLSVCTNLRTLVCSFNEIHKIEGLEGLKMLERLEMGFNFIKRMDGLQQLGNLKSLELNNNLLYRQEDLSLLKKHNPLLTDLNLSNNAISDVKSYRSVVLNKLESLEVLDSKALTDAERKTAASTSCTMTTELLLQCSHFVRRSQWSHLNKQGAVADKHLEGVTAQDDSWMGNVEELDMDHRRLRKISPLLKMTKLRRASFCDNELVKIEGLEQCLGLEELFLEENKITKIEKLLTLTNLRKLDLGRNKIVKPEGMQSLTMLSELSLEDNEIEELSSLQCLHSLMELYLCNNKVASLNELLWLKELPKLIILDMFGNPCFSAPEYRLHTIFYLKKLKVLDGVPVDMQELHDARDKYAGRITEEWIEEHLGHKDFGQVTELQLPGAFIREAQILFSAKFESLHQLNLDNNLIWDLSPFCNMPHLMILRLNGNRVGQGPSKTSSSQAQFNEELLLKSGFAADGLPSLEVLYLEGNHINSMARLGLSNLKNLRALHLSNNEITKIEGITSMQHLRELSLNKNKIKSVDDVAFLGLTSLRELSLDENGLKSLANFQYLAFLHTLHLTANRIQDFAEIDKLIPTRTLLDISIQNNPIARKAFYRVSIIKRLQSLQVIDGKPITWEERERADATAGDYRTQTMYPAIVQDTRVRSHSHSNSSAGHRVPVKVTSVTFECIGGVRAEDPLMLASKNGAPNIEMPLSREQQQAVLASQARDAENIHDKLSSRDEFFLPNVGQKVDFPRRRANTEHTKPELSKVSAQIRPQSTLGSNDKPPRPSVLNSFKNVSSGKQSRLTINAGSGSRHRSTPRTKTNLSR